MYTNLQQRRQIILAGLGTIGAELVVVSFSGGGDSGECDDITIIGANCADINDAAKNIGVTYTCTTTNEWRPTDSASHTVVTETLFEAVENLAHAELMNTGVDWYNNEGGDAEWTLNLVAGTQHLTVNQNEIVSEQTYNNGEPTIEEWIAV